MVTVWFGVGQFLSGAMGQLYPGGDNDACTLFNITDVHTNRPMRTYFRDRQIHINGDIVYGIWKYIAQTGDYSILYEGAAEVILECARFYYSYAYFSKDENRYEILNVVGPDEYHERVDNNAFTNMIVKHTLEIALKILKYMKKNSISDYNRIISELEFEKDIGKLEEMLELLYIPAPDTDTLIIEQFKGYLDLEEISLEALKERIIVPNEYLGGPNGLATTTRIIKQADVIMMLHLFKEKFSKEVKKANWEFYEPRCEHGSSLSACAYALVAADIGELNLAYKYFMKTATVDLCGNTKQYLGSLYIGGTHPAANGGAWMTAVFGFAGLSYGEDVITINPQIPDKWRKVKFKFLCKEQKYEVSVTKGMVIISADKNNIRECYFKVFGKFVHCKAGQKVIIEADKTDLQK